VYLLILAVLERARFRKGKFPCLVVSIE